jgi:hypothetical protein
VFTPGFDFLVGSVLLMVIVFCILGKGKTDPTKKTKPGVNTGPREG